MGKIDEARAMYEKGIEVTTRTGDAHTRSELQAALDMLYLSLTTSPLLARAVPARSAPDFQLHGIDAGLPCAFDIRRDIVGKEALGRFAFGMLERFGIDHRRRLQRATL